MTNFEKIKESLIDKLENGKIKKHSGSFIAYNREWLFKENNLEMEFDLLRKTRDAKVNKEGGRMTNFEKIKEMNKEEMIDFFFDILHCDECFLDNNKCDDGKCWNVVKKWLESEIDENDK